MKIIINKKIFALTIKAIKLYKINQLKTEIV